MDMAKVVKGLDCCIKQGEQGILDCDYDCPYGEHGNRLDCWIKMNRDALAMLKEQEEMLVKYSAFGGMKYGGCPRCNARIDNLVNPKACGFCGQAVKWE